MTQSNLSAVHSAVFAGTSASRPNEFELIARYFARLSAGFPGAYGLLDDVAVISPAAGQELVVKSDTIVGGVDFPPETPASLIARKALRVNLSDLAAKGAIPLAYILDLILPATISEEWIAAFAGGLATDQAEYSLHLIGGDTSSTSGPVTVAITVLGQAPMGRILRRGGAHDGDLIFVTGTIGDAALGLCALRGSLPDLPPSAAAFLTDRYRLPQPRVALRSHLLDIASSAIDISDGLVADLAHICAVSHLHAVVDGVAVPLSAAARTVIDGNPERLALALTGGDDYEVAFTASPSASARIEEVSRSLGIPITPIGRVAACSENEHAEVAVLGTDGQRIRFTSEGWTHFGAQ